jgi:hypothetical protein
MLIKLKTAPSMDKNRQAFIHSDFDSHSIVLLVQYMFVFNIELVVHICLIIQIIL